MAAIKNRRPRFKVGDWVTFLYGTWQVVAQIIDVSDLIGPKGIHHYRVRFSGKWTEPDSFWMPEDQLEPTPKPEQEESTI
jgi:hypothetical protein